MEVVLTTLFLPFSGHAEDVVFVFGMPQILLGTAFSDDEAKLSRDMITAWTNFAKTGSPQKMGDTVWEEAVDRTGSSQGSVRMIEMGDSYKMVTGVYTETCDAFWKPRIFA